MNSHRLDARRLMCPLPVIRTQQRIEGLANGDELLVIATDPGVMVDVPAWCRVHGHRIKATEQRNNEYRISILVCK